MKFLYRLVMDTGKIVLISAKSRGSAIAEYCKETGVSREWMDNHCKVVCVGRIDAPWSGGK